MNIGDMNNLGDAISSCSPIGKNDYPLALPSIHASFVRSLNSIIASKSLQPTFCRVFNENLLYFFYGGNYYKGSDRPTQNASECPIVFLFAPNLLKRLFRFYPFDTGAAAAGKYGIWTEKLGDFKNTFKVLGFGDYQTAPRMVYWLYGSNLKYQSGTPVKSGSNLPGPFPTLIEFLNTNLTGDGVDERQNTIEGHANVPIKLNEDLLWFGYPEVRGDLALKIFEITDPHCPRLYPYQTSRIFNPSQISYELHVRARKEMEQFNLIQEQKDKSKVK